MAPSRESERSLLLRVAHRAMVEHGFEPEFSPAALSEANALSSDGTSADGAARDLRALPWCSIDNDDSRDLDQLTVAGDTTDGCTTIRVAIADVSETVDRGTAIDGHAATNTTSVYTPPRIFPMLPERLSTDLTSLNPDVDRLAVVIEFAVGEDGLCGASAVYRALVHNHAKLAYRSVGAWLEDSGPLPPAAAAVPGLAENLKLQDTVAQRLKTQRHEHGALELETIELRPEMDGDDVTTLVAEKPNRARTLIEDFMIAANGTIARYLESQRFPVLRRV